MKYFLIFFLSALTIVFNVSVSAEEILFSPPIKGVVQTSELSVYSEPKPDSSVIGNIRDKKIVDVLAKDIDFYKVHTKELDGWVNSIFIKLDPNFVSSKYPVSKTINQDFSPPKIGVTNTPDVNVRIGPDTSFGIVDAIKEKKKTVEISKRKGNWYRLNMPGGKFGWVHIAFIDIKTTADLLSDSKDQKQERKPDKPLPLQIDLEQGRIFYDAGLFALEEGNTAEAENFLKQAVELDPKKPYYHFAMGKTCLNVSRKLTLSQPAKEYLKKAETHLLKAYKLDPNIPGLKYNLALVYYYKGNFEKASELFLEQYRIDSKNAIAQYFHAMCEFKLRRYEKAENLFYIIANTHPDLRYNCLYYNGLCAYHMKQYPKAIASFTQCKKLAPPESQYQSYSSKWIAAIDTQQQREKIVHLSAQVGQRHDDNIRCEPTDEDIYPKQEDDALIGAFAGKFNIINNNKVQFGFGYTHRSIKYNDLEKFDLTESNPEIFARFFYENLIAELNYQTSYYWLDSKKLLLRHNFSPLISLKLSELISTQFAYTFSKDDHMQNDDRDGKTNQVSSDIFVNLNSFAKIFGGLRYGNTDLSLDQLGFNQTQINTGLVLRPIKWLELTAKNQISDKEYNAKDSIFGVTRDDSYKDRSLSISIFTPSNHIKFNCEFNDIQNDSNITTYTYKRTMMTSYVILSY